MYIDPVQGEKLMLLICIVLFICIMYIIYRIEMKKHDAYYDDLRQQIYAGYKQEVDDIIKDTKEQLKEVDRCHCQK